MEAVSVPDASPEASQAAAQTMNSTIEDAISAPILHNQQVNTSNGTIASLTHTESAKTDKKSNKKGKKNIVAPNASKASEPRIITPPTSTEANARPHPGAEATIPPLSLSEIHDVFRPAADPSVLRDEVDIEIDLFKRFCDNDVPLTRKKLSVQLVLPTAPPKKG